MLITEAMERESFSLLSSMIIRDCFLANSFFSFGRGSSCLLVSCRPPLEERSLWKWVCSSSPMFSMPLTRIVFISKTGLEGGRIRLLISSLLCKSFFNFAEETLLLFPYFLLEIDCSFTFGHENFLLWDRIFLLQASPEWSIINSSNYNKSV